MQQNFHARNPDPPMASSWRSLLTNVYCLKGMLGHVVLLEECTRLSILFDVKGAVNLRGFSP